MPTSTMTAIAPLYPEVHPLALSPADEGRLAFNLGDDLEDNPFDRTKNAQAWAEWHDGWMATQRDCDRAEVEWEEYLDECMAW